MKIGIIGLGLMGGSIAKALKGKVEKIIAFDINKNDLILAKENNIIDEYSENIDDKFRGLDIIFVCVPVSKIVDVVNDLKNHIDDKTIITDIGSTKENIINKIRALDVRYVPGHPMVGREKSGFKYSISDLYENSYYILVEENTNIEDLKKVKEAVSFMNAKPIMIKEKEHDFLLAAISHLPHVIAVSLVNTVRKLETENNLMKTLAAGGFKDITRIASSDSVMWEGICLENKLELLKLITEFEANLSEMKECIKTDKSVKEYFITSKEYRDSIDVIKKDNELDIFIKNVPGTLAKVTNILAENCINVRNISIIDNIDEKAGELKLFFENSKVKEEAKKVLLEFIN